MPIRVLADSACDLPAEIVDEHRLTIVPLTIRFGTEELTEVSPEEFWARCRRSPVLPETAAPSPGAFVAAFRRLAEEGADGVVCINLSSKLSATIQSAQAAAREVADVVPVRVVDSLNVSLGMGLQVIDAARLAEEGMALDEIGRTVEAGVPRVRVYATLDTLDNLKKGGRIGGAQAFLGSMLSVKPVIEVAEGEVEQESRPRTRSRALRYLADKVEEAAKAGPIDRLVVMHGDASDIDTFVAMVTPLVPDGEVLVGRLGPVIGTHAGPGVIGVGWVAPVDGHSPREGNE
jgi:DegV family protein with EDD domain